MVSIKTNLIKTTVYPGISSNQNTKILSISQKRMRLQKNISID